jgi:hypothetical protein
MTPLGQRNDQTRFQQGWKRPRPLDLILEVDGMHEINENTDKFLRGEK